MGNFNRDNRSNGRPSFGQRSGGDREMHQATCSNCGKDCQVPFRPTGARPIFCSDCFEKNGGESRRSNDRDFAPRRNFDDRRPSFDTNRSFSRPQYNNDRPQESARPQQGNDQFASLNAKLDRIITLLTPKQEFVAEKPSVQAEEVKPVAEKKPRAPRKTKTAPITE